MGFKLGSPFGVTVDEQVFYLNKWDLNVTQTSYIDNTPDVLSEQVGFKQGKRENQ